MSGLTIHLLGSFDVAVDGRSVGGLQLERVRALLAYLAVESDRPHLRESLACLLWPDATDDSARANLRQAIYKLRLALDEQRAPHYLQVSPGFIQLPPAETVWVDTREFSALIHASEKHHHARLNNCIECLAKLRRATEFYRGDFLSGLALPDSLGYQEWAAVRHAEYRDGMLNALSRLAAAAWETAAYEEADALARQHLSLEPWSEEAHRLRMRSAAATGRRAAALQQYEVCRRTLRNELGIEPDAATEALYREIKAGTRCSQQPAPRAQQATAVRPADISAVHASERTHRAPVPPPSPDAGPLLRELPRPLFVGRERESAWLDERLAQVLERQGQVALVTGSSGSGKSALLNDFARRALDADLSLVVAGTHFNMAGDAGGLSAFLEILRLFAADLSAFRAVADATSQHWQHAHAALPDFLSALTAEGPDLIGLLAGCDSGDAGGPALPGDRQLQALLAARPPSTVHPAPGVLFDQLVRTLRVFARTHPLVITLDDIQWMGQDAAMLFFYLATRLARSRILLLGSYRSSMSAGEETQQPPLTRVIHELHTRFGDVELDLDEADGRSFVGTYLQAASGHADDNLVEAVFTRTQGHPLFTIELARMLGEKAAQLTPGLNLQNGMDEWQVTWNRLPARLDAVLEERIRGLPPGWQRTLEIASVQGSTFAAEVVAQVQGEETDEIIRRLSGPLLTSYRLVYAQGLEHSQDVCLSLYRFQNAFVRDLLYGRLDSVQKARWHQATAAALEQILGESSNVRAGRLARHYQLANNTEKALVYLERAAHCALKANAYRQAHQYFAQALELLSSFEENTTRSKRELRLRLGLDRALRLAEGWDVAARGQGVSRALELGERADADSQMQALYLQADLHISRWEVTPAIVVGERMLALATATGGPAHLALAQAALGDAYWFAGDYRQACAYLEPAIQYCETHPDEVDPFTAAFDHAIVDHIWCAFSYEALGDPASASRHAAASLAHAEGSSPSRVYALIFVGCLFPWIREDPEGAVCGVDEVTAAATGHDLPASLGPWLALWQSWQQARRGDRAALAKLATFTEAWDSPPAGFSWPLRTLLLAESYRVFGQTDDALGAIEKGIRGCTPGTRYPLESELWRVKGELLLERLPVAARDEGFAVYPVEALACFRQAEELARASGDVVLARRASRSVTTLSNASQPPLLQPDGPSVISTDAPSRSR